MMVLRHLSASAATGPIGCRNENTSEEERVSIPMDLSKSKSGHHLEPSVEPVPLNLNKNSYGSLCIPPIRPLSSSSRSSENIINNNTITNNNNNIDLSAKTRNNHKSESPVNFSTRRGSPSSHNHHHHHGVVNNPIPSGGAVSITPQLNNHHPHHQQPHRRSRKADLRWREFNLVHGSGGDDDDNNTFSSPDSGLHRDSPGEEDEVTATKPLSPSSLWRSPLFTSTSSTNNNTASTYLRKQSHPCLIPLSHIRAQYKKTNVSPDKFPGWDEEEQFAGNRAKVQKCEVGGEKVQNKMARLEDMVTQLKTTKDPRMRHYSGDDDTSSGEHATSSDEVLDDGPTDLRNSSSSSYRKRKKGMMFRERKVKVEKGVLNLIKDEEYEEEDEDGNEPCNLAYPKSSSPRSEGIDIEQWKKQAQGKSTSPFSLSPTDAGKLCGIDPETYQQQIMQLQLTSAAMMGDPSGLLKALGSCPPWLYVGYYSQLLQSFQAQEILRQYAIQSTSSPQNNSNNQGGDKTPTTTMRSTVASSTNYHSQSSPLSPASVNEGNAGVDSDGSVVGLNTPSGLNGKRAPRAMTGRHVRTGTGASPSTLLTLRQKIEERQRVKAQHARQQEALLHSQTKTNKNGNSKFSRKSGKK